MNPEGKTFLVRRDDLASMRIDTFDADAPLAEGEARLRIERFALTANNITYAVFGDSMHYWQFFPAPEGWGIVPVWGFASVQASRCEGVAVGRRVYGYWPMASHATVVPGSVSATGFADASAHRSGLPAIYNRYRFVDDAATPGTGRDHEEGLYAVLRPLFTTAWLIDDFMHESEDFGARTLLLSSASSKTAYATAFCLKRAAGRHARVVGVTSPSRLGFCRGLGVYDEVISYADVTQRPADEPTVYIDFAGDAPFRRRVHEHWRDALAHSCSVGGTHHTALGSGADLPGPRPQLFFAPTQAARRGAPPPQGLGMGEMMKRVDDDWSAFVARATSAQPPWITIETRSGAEAVTSAYLQTLRGEAHADKGLMLSL